MCVLVVVFASLLCRYTRCLSHRYKDAIEPDQCIPLSWQVIAVPPREWRQSRHVLSDREPRQMCSH